MCRFKKVLKTLLYHTSPTLPALAAFPLPGYIGRGEPPCFQVKGLHVHLGGITLPHVV